MGVARPLPPLAIHGRLPPRKGFVASGARVSAAAIHPVSTATPAAGLDEFRGPAPDHKRGLFRPWQATGSYRGARARLWSVPWASRWARPSRRSTLPTDR